MSNIQNAGVHRYIEVTIPSGSDTSDTADMQDFIVTGIIMPATLTGDNFTFLGGLDEANLLTINSTADNVVNVVAGSGARIVGLIYDNFLGVARVRVKSNGTEAADRKFTIIGRKPE